MSYTTSTLQSFGGRVMDVWRGMRPATRSLVERALAAGSAPPQQTANLAALQRTPYDAPAEADLSRLLRALDERLIESHTPRAEKLSPQQRDELQRVIETCVVVLRTAAQSAESFMQLFERALAARDYRQVDSLADSLIRQLPPSELCELARHDSEAVRLLAAEALTQLPVSLLVELLADPVDAEAARRALQTQARDYESEEARWVLEALCVQDEGETDD